jgi:hypothetical protein
MLWIKNTDGKPSASLTFATSAFVIVMINYILSMFENLGPLHIRAFDATAVSALLMPLFALYFGRRYTSEKFNLEAMVPVGTVRETTVASVKETTVE